MRICYVLLSTNFGIHQYTADLANRMVSADHDVHLVTTSRRVPRDRYVPAVTIHTPVETTHARLSVQAFRFRSLANLRSELCTLSPDVVHITGPHAWNVPLVRTLNGQEIPVVHTLHSLDSLRGPVQGSLFWLWNTTIIESVDHILVHSQALQQRLLAAGVPRQRMTCTPLLHLFLGSTRLQTVSELATSVTYEPWALFFGRLNSHKGLDHLITACAMMDEEGKPSPRVVIAGRGDLSAVWSGPFPKNLEVHNQLISDEMALDLFCRCGLVVLPYVDATQSALVAAAYWFSKPVVVTRTGALPEYVQEGHTGRLVEPGHPPTLARCLDRLLDDPDRLAWMGAAGRAWYDARRMNEEYTILQMYSGLARQQSTLTPVAQLSDRAILE